MTIEEIRLLEELNRARREIQCLEIEIERHVAWNEAHTKARVELTEKLKILQSEETAEAILESLDRVIQVNWNLRDMYVGAIMKGLNRKGMK